MKFYNPKYSKLQNNIFGFIDALKLEKKTTLATMKGFNLNIQFLLFSAGIEKINRV
jgi:hypothetical protein